MLSVFWTLLNFLLFTGLIILFIRALWLLKKDLGISAAFIFLFGILAMNTRKKEEAPAAKQIPKEVKLFMINKKTDGLQSISYI
jgi:hypothetical protein